MTTDDRPPEARLTRRQRLLKRLEDGPATLRELATEARTGLKQTSRELDHVAKSIKPRRIDVEPAVCEECGFEFSDRSRWTTPSRCPKCRSERISEPVFSL